MKRLARLWPFRRPADPALVREFRIKDRPEVHRVEAGTPLADARDRGAIVLFEVDDVGKYALGIASNDKGKPFAMIDGWTTYSRGHVSDALGNVAEKRIAVAWGWPIEAEPEPPAEEAPAKPKRTRARAATKPIGPSVAANDPRFNEDGELAAAAADAPRPQPRRPRAKGVPQAKRGG